MFCQDLRMLLSFAIGALFAQLLQGAGLQNQYHGDGDDNDDHDEFDKKLGLYIFMLWEDGITLNTLLGRGTIYINCKAGGYDVEEQLLNR